MPTIVKARKYSIQWFLLRRMGSSALVDVFNLKIYYLKTYPSPALIRHECKHIEQIKRYGKLGYLALWNYYNALYGYDNNPLELEAKAAEAGG